MPGQAATATVAAKVEDQRKEWSEEEYVVEEIRTIRLLEKNDGLEKRIASNDAASSAGRTKQEMHSDHK